MFSPEDLAQLGEFIDQKIKAGVEDMRQHLTPAPQTAEQQAAARASIVGVPDVPHDAGPEYWVHLANGDVITSHDSVSTHMKVDGQQVQVTGRFQVPDGYKTERENQ